MLYWLGNGISMGMFLDVVDTACLPFDHRRGADRAAALQEFQVGTGRKVEETKRNWMKLDETR